MGTTGHVRFEGSFVALVTPFREDGSIDYDRIAELIEFHIGSGTDGIVPCGCTGEAATLGHEEQKAIMEFVTEKVAGRVLVVPGTGSNNTQEALDLTLHAQSVGADAALLISPYYNKPTQAGLIAHYRYIADKTDLPLIVYNVPGRTARSIEPATIAELAKLPTVVAVKEASGSIDQVNSILNLCDIIVLSGDDSLTLPMMAIGARGVISVTANIMPSPVARMVHAYLDGRFAVARELHFDLLDLSAAMFVETNPIPVKYALSEMGKIENNLRLPLTPLADEYRATVKNALDACRDRLANRP